MGNKVYGLCPESSFPVDQHFAHTGYISQCAHFSSCASIEGATRLIIYNATTAAVAVFLALFVPIYGLYAFKSGVRKAVETTLGYLWFSLHLLALPFLLSFAINGFSITLALPVWYTIVHWVALPDQNGGCRSSRYSYGRSHVGTRLDYRQAGFSITKLF